MLGKDPHHSLKTLVIGNARATGAELVLAQLQWGKNDVAHSLHVNPNTWSSAGLQLTDFLNYLGFKRSACPLSPGGECYVNWVPADFNIAQFAASLGNAFAKLGQAEKSLQACGFFLEQPEGWGYFHGKRSGASRATSVRMTGDGHTAAKTESMKKTEDETFLYRLSWLDTGREKGWTIHYRPKHSPLSAELQGVFEYFKLSHFAECPEFNFEKCHWRSIPFVSRSDGPFDSNAQTAHSWFDAHSAHFSPGIQQLLAAHSEVEKFGFGFLKFPAAAERLSTDIEKKIIRPAKRDSHLSSAPSEFDVAISFAGTERAHAEQLATILKDNGYSVFYDDFFPEYLWGKNLVDTFDEIFRKRARYCVMFVSREYNERVWTNHERQSAQARALTEKGRGYILPIKVDETELAGMPPTLGYMPIGRGIPAIAELLIKKLKQ